MSSLTTIEWTRGLDGSAGATSNPVTGCTKVSPGCAHCYAETFAERFRGVAGHPYEQGFGLRLWPERLELPLRWRKPRLIFTNSMSDLFHEGVPEDFVAEVFSVMERAHWHTFQVLTKRSERLLELAPGLPWPANVWLGVSIENRRFVHRADSLRRVPAAVHFISAEPLLGPLGDLDLQGIDWLIAGGESGHGARPLDLDWVRDLVARCRAAGVALFVKLLCTKRAGVCICDSPRMGCDRRGGRSQPRPAERGHGRRYRGQSHVVRPGRVHLATELVQSTGQLGTRWAGRGKGGDPSLWPEDLRLRQMPVVGSRRGEPMASTR